MAFFSLTGYSPFGTCSYIKVITDGSLIIQVERLKTRGKEFQDFLCTHGKCLHLSVDRITVSGLHIGMLQHDGSGMFTSVVVCTDLSGKEPHRWVGW